MRRVVRVLSSSARTAHVETDDGEAYVKALGNPEGPHILACELVGTRAAAWLGLPVLDHVILNLKTSDVVAYPESSEPEIGPAYATRALPGTTWGDNEEALEAIENSEAIAGLVVLDTWLLNCDRYRVRGDEIRANQRNVFLADEGAARGRFRLMAIDHTHAFTCGAELSAKKLQRIELIQSTEVFGLFPKFVPLVTRSNVAALAKRLAAFSKGDASKLVAGIPAQWGCTPETAATIGEFLTLRAAFVSARIEDMLTPSCGWNAVLDFKDNGNG